MERPTREHVDATLGSVDLDKHSTPTERFLAAEVRALREENRRHQLMHDSLRGTIAALRGELPAGAQHHANDQLKSEVIVEAEAEARGRVRARFGDAAMLTLANINALVKAAREVPENMAILRLSDRDKEVSELLYAIHKTLEPFETERSE